MRIKFQYLLEGMNGHLETDIGTDLSLKGIKNANNIKDDNLTDIDFLQKYMPKKGTNENK